MIVSILKHILYFVAGKSSLMLHSKSSSLDDQRLLSKSELFGKYYLLTSEKQ